MKEVKKTAEVKAEEVKEAVEKKAEETVKAAEDTKKAAKKATAAAAKKATTAAAKTTKKAATATKKTVTAAAKTAKKATATVKKTAEKKTVKKAAAVKETISLQYFGKDIKAADLMDQVKAIWTGELGKNAADLKTINLYLKPEDNAAYYVINDSFSGRVDF